MCMKIMTVRERGRGRSFTAEAQLELANLRFAALVILERYSDVLDVRSKIALEETVRSGQSATEEAWRQIGT